MLLKGYTKEIFNSKCMPGAVSVHCHAHLNENIEEVLPYLNAELGGDSYTQDPPSVTFKLQGKLITVHPEKIAINALKDESEADKIITWLQREINSAWENRSKIEPRYKGVSKPVVLEILKLLPKTNCQKCGDPTCLVFATLAAKGVRDQNSCPDLAPQDKKKLGEYLSQFSFE